MTVATAALLAVLVSTSAPRAEAPSPPAEGRLFLGSSLFMLGNLTGGNEPPAFYQLNAGYRLTASDALSLEAITWRYYHPLGIPWGSPRESRDTAYPGHVREYGVGAAYQRFLWRGAYASLSAIPLLREYRDPAGRKLATGFQLFLTARLGYHLRFWDRLFLEPSIAATAWPVTTRVPEGFAAQDRRWPRFFLLEPGLHFGVDL